MMLPRLPSGAGGGKLMLRGRSDGVVLGPAWVGAVLPVHDAATVLTIVDCVAAGVVVVSGGGPLMTASVHRGDLAVRATDIAVLRVVVLTLIRA
jgi:hypothetical protein